MSEIRIFKTKNGVEEIILQEAKLERQIQNLVENNMEKFFGVRFIKSEWAIEDGRMDSIGLDENNCPVIFEYKKSQNDNVINQGLFYLDWLVEHKEAFQMLVREKFGDDTCDSVDFSAPSVFCIAGDFSNYDVHAVKQIGRNIKLVKYRIHDDDIVLFEQLNAPKAAAVISQNNDGGSNSTSKYVQKTHLEKLESAPEKIRMLYREVCDYIESLDDDLSVNQLKYYVAYRKVQNVFCIEVYNSYIAIRTKLDPKKNDIIEGFTRDMTHTGHYGTGDFEIQLKNESQLEAVKDLLRKAIDEQN